MKFQAIILIAFLTGLLADPNIRFMVYKQGVATFDSTDANEALLLSTCSTSNKISFILHGWTPSAVFAPLTWVAPMVSAYQTAEAGSCVIFMNYTYYSTTSSILISSFENELVPKYDDIKNVLVDKLVQLETLGYDPAKIALFGFSFGAQVVLGAGYDFGALFSAFKIGRVDACDPAGPGFTSSSHSVVNAANAATNVQCIHTSSTLGTTLRTCQKNVNMGSCGKYQPGPGLIMPGSHNFCPTFFTSAFTNVFKFVAPSSVQSYYATNYPVSFFAPLNSYLQGSCSSHATHVAGAQPVPSPNSRMGYYINFAVSDGEYYALAKHTSPYNVV